MNKTKDYFQKIKTSKSFLFWNILIIISLFSVIFSIIAEYYYYNPEKGTRSLTQERQYIIFKFTLWSNIFSVIVPFLIIFNIFEYKSATIKRLKVLMVANLTLTMIVFWALVFPERIKEGLSSYFNAQMLTGTLFEHLIVPILCLITFIVDAKEYKDIKDKEMNILKTSFINLSFILIWSIIACIIYFIYGAEKKDAIYSFIAFKQNAWYKSVIYIPAIFGIYFGFNCLFSVILSKIK